MASDPHRPTRLLQLAGIVLAPSTTLAYLTSCTEADSAAFPQAEDFEAESATEVVGTAGNPVDERPTIRVRDESGGPVTGYRVVFQVDEGGGRVEPDTVLTDREGRARVDEWVLGDRAGENLVTAEVGLLGEARFEARGEPGPPAEMEAEAPDSQSAAPGEEVAEPPAVRVTDRLDNPVEGVPVNFSVVEGDGEVEGAERETDATGVAAVDAWRLGPAEGLNRVRARVDGVGEVHFEATPAGDGDPPEDPGSAEGVQVESVRLNQGSQDGDGSVGGVAGRPGLLRVLVSAEGERPVAPDVLVRLHSATGLVREETIPGPDSGIPEAPDPARDDHTWNLELPGDRVDAGLSVEVLVDPDSTLTGDRSGLRYPAGGEPRSLDVQPLPPLAVRFIPIEYTDEEITGDVSPERVDDLLERTRQWIPSAEIQTTVAPSFATDRDLSARSEWTGLLSDLHAVRADAGTTDEYYHGIVPDFDGRPLSGLAYVPGNPGSEARVALSYDRLPGASTVVAHELGHNLGLYHAPCGNPGGVNEDYPYSDGRVEAVGYDVENRSVVDPDGRRDYMGYCAPRWTSDYSYAEILEWRRNDPLAEASGTLVRGEVPALLLWGRTGGEGAVLEPAFSVEAAPRVPEGEGPYELQGLDSRGAEVFSVSFQGERLGHGASADVRHFAFAVPLPPEEQARVARIRLDGPSGSVERRAGAREPGAVVAPDGVLEADDPGVRVSPLPGGRARVTWDTDGFPAAMVRDEAGRIRGISRTGEVELPAGDGLEVLVSDGVSSRRGDAGGR